MMDSVRLFFRNFIKYFLYIAVFAQIVSGTVYLVCNFSDYIMGPETEEMLDVAGTLIFDEYVGVLYPLFLKLCVFVQKISGIGYYYLVYLVQMAVFGLALWYVTKMLFSGKKVWLAGAFVLMNPMCIHTILMVSPYAFKTAFGLWILGAMLRLWKDGWKGKHWCVLLFAYFMAALNVPDDLYVWLVPVVIFTISVVLKKQDTVKVYGKICILLAIVLVFFTAFGIGKGVSEPGARGRMQKTVSSVLFQRTLWPELRTKYGFLPMDMIVSIPHEVAMASDGSPEQIQYIIGPLVEEAYGLKRADELFKEAVLNQFSYNKTAMFKAVLSDFAGYAMTPYSTMGYITGQEGAAFGKLYSLMSVSMPRFVYGYYCVSFVALFLLTFAAVLKQVKEKAFVKKEKIRQTTFFAGIILYQAMWYAIVNVQGVDYRYVLLNVVLFSYFALGGILKTDCKERNAQ